MSYLNIEKRNQTAIVWLDQPDEEVNTLTAGLIEEFYDLFERLSSNPDISSVVLISKKKHNFIAGADLNLLKSFQKPADVDAFNKKGNDILNKIAEFSKPVVAAINGSCLGGGLEVALACHYRLASTGSHTNFGAPEVKLGLLPGGGGTQRLPALIGLQKAFDMLLTGKNVYPRSALKMGLVDQLVDESMLLKAATETAISLAGKKEPPRREKRGIGDLLIEETLPGRKVIYAKAKESVLEKTKGNYPAPLKIVQCVETGVEQGFEEGRELEAQYFTELIFTKQSRELINLFFATRESRQNPLKGKIKPVTEVGVLGAGLMGSGIANVTIREAKLPVFLKDRDLEVTGAGMRSIWSDLEYRISKHIISKFESDNILSRLVATSSYDALKNVDLVIEAVFEDLEIKREVMKETETAVGDECIIASNTSSLPITEIAKNMKHKERVLGMHYFSPVPKMPLLEIIRTKDTADWAIATAYETGLRQGKTVILVNDGPGFYTTRILAPYMNEALNLLMEGASVEVIDGAMTSFGFPVGPLTLMDEVGIDIATHVTEVLAPLFKKRGLDNENMARKILDAGYKGRKNGRGFYSYENNKRKDPNEKIYSLFDSPEPKKHTPDEIQRRISLMMINEAILCLQEGVLTKPVDGDLGAVMGLGFPPFMGGPFRYVDAIGAASIFSSLEQLEEDQGARFQPAVLLKDQMKKKATFYGTRNRNPSS